MRRALPCAAILVVCLVGCKSDEVKSAQHKLSWKPPRGVALTGETAERLSFSGGVEIVDLPGPPKPLGEEGQLDGVLLDAMTRAKLAAPDKRISGRLGDIPAGKVGRWVLAGGGSRMLVYYLPRADRALVIAMSAAEAQFGTKENQLDLSLSTLKIE